MPRGPRVCRSSSWSRCRSGSHRPSRSWASGARARPSRAARAAPPGPASQPAPRDHGGGGSEGSWGPRRIGLQDARIEGGLRLERERERPTRPAASCVSRIERGSRRGCFDQLIWRIAPCAPVGARAGMLPLQAPSSTRIGAIATVRCKDSEPAPSLAAMASCAPAGVLALTGGRESGTSGGLGCMQAGCGPFGCPRSGGVARRCCVSGHGCGNRLSIDPLRLGM